jgi:1-acyl-sn-glycerol-3-phosphate acyltransferase
MTSGPAAASDVASDVWGRSPAARRITHHLLDPAYRWWFRVDWEGLDHIPRDGPALLVANHAGVVPVDGALIVHGIEKETGRTIYALHHHALRSVPGLGVLFARNGGVVAHPDNALRLLRDERALVLVFPEGTKGTTKPWSQRYRLQRFGRGGFVETAMRAGAPIVPIAVHGTEATMPAVGAVHTADGQRVPITLNAMLLGPLLAYVPLPAKIRVRVLPPVRTEVPTGLASYPPSVVADVAEDVRAQIQAELDRIRNRGSTVAG